MIKAFLTLIKTFFVSIFRYNVQYTASIRLYDGISFKGEILFFAKKPFVLYDKIEHDNAIYSITAIQEPDESNTQYGHANKN